MRTFVAVVVGQGRTGFVQTIHVAAGSYRKAAALVLRQVRRFRGVKDFQISLRALDEGGFVERPGILAASFPLYLGPPERAVAS